MTCWSLITLHLSLFHDSSVAMTAMKKEGKKNSKKFLSLRWVKDSHFHYEERKNEREASIDFTFSTVWFVIIWISVAKWVFSARRRCTKVLIMIGDDAITQRMRSNSCVAVLRRRTNVRNTCGTIYFLSQCTSVKNKLLDFVFFIEYWIKLSLFIDKATISRSERKWQANVRR